MKNLTARPGFWLVTSVVILIILAIGPIGFPTPARVTLAYLLGIGLSFVTGEIRRFNRRKFR